MKAEAIPILSDGLRIYLDPTEVSELCAAFDIELPSLFQDSSYLIFARHLVEKAEHGNTRRFLAAVIPQLVNRCEERIARTKFEGRDFHQGMLPRLESLAGMLGEPGIPEEITVAEGRPFSAKSEAREFLAAAESAVMIIDPYIGIGTLDCLRDVRHPLRVLTGEKPNSIEQGFEQAVKDFRSEGHSIEIRQHPKLHDRYLIFNDRCWLVGSSLKDAGKKTFSIIEMVDGRATILSEVEKKWAEARSLPPLSMS
jgi:hypothetical protein